MIADLEEMEGVPQLPADEALPKLCEMCGDETDDTLCERCDTYVTEQAIAEESREAWRWEGQAGRV